MCLEYIAGKGVCKGVELEWVMVLAQLWWSGGIGTGEDA